MIEPVYGYLLGELANLCFKLGSMSACLKTLDEQNKNKEQVEEINRGLKAKQIRCGIYDARKNADYQNQEGDDCPEDCILDLHL